MSVQTDCHRLRLCFGLLFCACITASGCGGDSGTAEPERAVVTGTVTYDQKPVANGTISFVPENGPAAGGPIADGKYLIDAKGGVPVGTAKVEIQAFEETGKEVIIGAGGKTSKETRQVLPAKYNSASTTTVTIAVGEENKHDFNLTK